MLIELAIGDAYGAGFEYAKDSFVYMYNNLNEYIQHPRHKTLPGQYTDDTQMSIAIAEFILEDKDWNLLNLAQKFVEVFKRDPREGYSRGFYKFLKSVNSGEDFLEYIRPDSQKSGAAMRACPIGLYSDINEVIEKAELQATLTHDTEIGVNSSIAAALMTHYCFYQIGPPHNLGHFLNQHTTGKWNKSYEGTVKSAGWMSVSAAKTALTRNSWLSELLLDCIQFTGDVDTVATIALAAGSCAYFVENDLPAFLFDSLENDEFGKDYLETLDKKLLDRFG